MGGFRHTTWSTSYLLQRSTGCSTQTRWEGSPPLRARHSSWDSFGCSSNMSARQSHTCPSTLSHLSQGRHLNAPVSCALEAIGKTRTVPVSSAMGNVLIPQPVTDNLQRRRISCNSRASLERKLHSRNASFAKGIRGTPTKWVPILESVSLGPQTDSRIALDSPSHSSSWPATRWRRHGISLPRPGHPQ